VKLPLLISAPHAGLAVPEEVAELSILTPEQIARDGDVGAAEIFSIADDVEAFVAPDIARAFVDLNRTEDDRRTDGVVKTHTCWNEPVYRSPLGEELVERMLARYYRPYHARLTALAGSSVRLGIDCHTMAAHGPPVGPDPGRERPWICLGHGDGTCPREWMDALARSFERAFGRAPSINEPFAGGYITRVHAAEMPWVQLELSRAPFMPPEVKRASVLTALRDWCAWLDTHSSS
jgi:N-formylglutamate amidohydrolase